MTFPHWPLSRLAFVAAFAVYAAVAGNRLLTQSSDPHFVLQAHAWLHGRLDIDQWPDTADDPAVVERVALSDGRVVRGRRLVTRDVFRVAGGEQVPLTSVVAQRGVQYYVGFPPFPALLFVPIVLLFGGGASDVLVTVVLAACMPVLCLAVLRRLRESGISLRSPREDLWLAVLLSFGTVAFVGAVQGRVWYTAHIVAIDLALLYAWASIDARRPWLAGLALGCAFLTRGQLLFMFPLFAGEMWRTRRTHDVRRWIAFAVPVLLIGLAAAAYNYARFGEPAEFGYHYLAVRQQADIERYGMFDPRYVPRNLVAAFLLLPRVGIRPPYLTISGHGLAIWLTTPALLLLIALRPRGTFHRALLVTAGSVAIWTLLYQNTGWVQFGYRFALDYLVFLILLFAVDRRPLGTTARVLIVLAVCINLFGAITFERFPRFYRTDAAAYHELAHD